MKYKFILFSPWLLKKPSEAPLWDLGFRAKRSPKPWQLRLHDPDLGTLTLNGLAV